MSDIFGARMGPEGRVLIPRQLREALGFCPGDELALVAEDGRLVLASQGHAIQELQGMFKHVGGSMADELIRQRHDEAKRDLE